MRGSPRLLLLLCFMVRSSWRIGRELVSYLSRSYKPPMNTSMNMSATVSNVAYATQAPSESESEVLQPLTRSRWNKECQSYSTSKFSVLRGVLEGLIDGILILSEQGTLIEANNHALNLCHQLMQNASSTSEIPQQIWSICQELIKSRNVFPGQRLVLEDEISLGEITAIRIRARWIELKEINRPYLLVVLEDRCESLNNVASTEAHKYGLTKREAQIWLLRRTNQTYKAIAAELHIAIDTVKKHIKNINVKREAVLGTDK